MTAQVLDEAITALGEAATAERGIRFGSDVVRVLHAALLDATEEPHRHAWQPLGVIDGPQVVMACSCGAAQRVAAEVAS